jgi:prevent-host-death family protein
MAVTSTEIVPLTRARAKLTELVEEVRTEGNEKIITRNGKSCAALIGADRLDHYHRLEREHIHLTLLDQALRGVDDLEKGKTIGLAKLKSRHRRWRHQAGILKRF